MQRFIAVRVLQSVFAVLVMSVIVFGLARVSGNPLDVMLPIEATQADYERLEKHWGLDKPVLTQYFLFLGNALQGDFGESLKYQGTSAMELVWQRLPATLELAGLALLISVIIALPIGVVAAVGKDTGWDVAAKVIALLGQSLPGFWLGIVLMWIFAVTLGWLPTSGRGGIEHLILPAITIGWFQVAAMMRLVRSSMLDVLDSEFVKLARVVGTVVSTITVPVFEGRTLLLCDLLGPDGAPAGGHLIAVDTVGAGPGETVLLLDEGNGARQILGAPNAPVRTLVVGIVDDVTHDGETRAEAPAPLPRRAPARARTKRRTR